jgi:hypothetical protein
MVFLLKWISSNGGGSFVGLESNRPPRKFARQLTAGIDFGILALVLLAFQIAINSNENPDHLRIHDTISWITVVILVGLMVACGGGSSGGVGNRGQTFTVSIQGVSPNFPHLTSAVLVVD